MNDRHSKLLSMLKQFNIICEKHGIEYYLTGGSALGAIRHEGFIPWDDDIDIGMIRSEWKKLKPILKEELSNDLLLVDYDLYDTYCNPIIKIVDTKSTDLYRASLADGTPKGQYLEIFILDPVPKSKIEYHREMFWIYCELMTPYFPIINENLKFKHFSILKYNYYKLLCKIFGKKRIIKAIEKRIFSYDITQCEYLLLGWGLASNYYPKENFGRPKYVKFEDMLAPVGEKYAALFYQDYGDHWMNYPEQHEQNAHVTITNTSVSYNKYMKEILSLIDADEINKLRLKSKNNTIKNFKEIIEYNDKLNIMHLKHIEYILDNNKCIGIAQMLFDKKEFKALYEHFKELYSLIPKFSRYELKLNINNKMAYYSVFAAIANGELKLAQRILSCLDNVFSDRSINLLQNNCLLFETIRCEYYCENYNVALNNLKLVDKVFYDTYIYVTLNAKTIVKGSRTYNYNELLKQIESLQIKYSEDCDLVKIKADILMNIGKETEANVLYEYVLENSNNGMDIKEIINYKKGLDW